MNTTHTTWQAKMSEANDALGCARTALARTTSPSKRRAIFEEIEFWSNKRAYVEAAIRSGE